MDFEDFFSACHIRSSYDHIPVETSRTQDRRIQNIFPVCRRHNDNALVDAESVHLDKQLVQRLLTLVMTAAQTTASSSRHSVDLIDKDDTRCVPFGVLKQISYTGSADTDKHLHEIRTGNTEKRNSRLACDCFCKQRLTGSRRSLQKNAFRDTRSDLNIFLRRFQEIYDLLQLFFFLPQSGNLCKGHFLLIRRTHFRTALPEIHCFGITSAILTVHQHKK